MLDVIVFVVLIYFAVILVMFPFVLVPELRKKYREKKFNTLVFSRGFYKKISDGELGPGSVVLFMFKGCDVIAWVNGDGDTTTMIDYRLYGDLQDQEGKQISFPMFRLSDFAEISEASKGAPKSQHTSNA